MTTKLYSHRIKDTDKVVQVRKVSSLLARELLKEFPEPPIPTNKVILNGQEIYEENESDPDYREKLRKHKTKLTEAMNNLLIDRGVFVVLTEEDKQEVNELKEWWQDKYSKPLSGSDEYIFVRHICISTMEDLKELLTAITRRTQATQEGTQQALETFPSEIQGSEG